MNLKNKLKTERIIFFGNADLRAKCTPVTVFHKGLHEKIDVIRNTLKKNGAGAALAAPQISILKQIIVINYLGEYYELINPVITESLGEQDGREGCLSLPRFVGTVKRFERITVTYQDRFGTAKSIETEHEMARCFQHEIDHINGILYIDRMTEKFVYNDDTEEKIPVQQLLELTKCDVTLPLVPPLLEEKRGGSFE
jgi:peptide deformylase